MDNEELQKLLITATYEKRFDDLMALLDEHQPDFTHADFNFKGPEHIQKQITIGPYKGVNQLQITGRVPPNIAGGYQIFKAHGFNAKKGYFEVNPAGDWTYTITNQVMIDTISGEGSVTVNEQVTVLYSKELVFRSIAHEIGAYVSQYCTCEDMQKVLDLGLCPNSNKENSQRIGISNAKLAGKTAVMDKYASDSRMLINAVNRNDTDMATTLINHACPCCNGSGAKVTGNILVLAPTGSDMHTLLGENNA